LSLHRRLCRGLLAGLSALGGAATCSAGCGSSARPPQDGEIVFDAGTADASQQFQATAPTALSCNLGPDGGVCACADQPLLGVPPNLYFVLDLSASMSENNKWRTVVSAIADLVVGLGPRAKIAATVFPDPRFDACTSGLEVFPPTQGDSPAGHAGPVEGEFLTQLGVLTPAGGTPTAATLQALAPRLAALTGKTYVILATDGGPNCNIDASCGASQCELNIENSASGCTPGGSLNCCNDPNYGSDPQLSCLDAQPTTDAVTAIAQEGIPVYVVGVPGSAPYASLLDDLATAGGTARGSEPQYYAVDTGDQAAFTAAISAVAAKITGTCTLTLDKAPPDPAQVNVFVDEQVLPQTGADGWTIDGQIVTILGQTCQNIMTGAVLDVRVVAGCPTFER
jgi:hypothetical protein